MRMLRLYSAEDLAACERDKWSIPDPTLWRRDIHTLESPLVAIGGSKAEMKAGGEKRSGARTEREDGMSDLFSAH